MKSGKHHLWMALFCHLRNPYRNIYYCPWLRLAYYSQFLKITWENGGTVRRSCCCGEEQVWHPGKCWPVSTTHFLPQTIAEIHDILLVDIFTHGHEASDKNKWKLWSELLLRLKYFPNNQKQNKSMLFGRQSDLFPKLLPKIKEIKTRRWLGGLMMIHIWSHIKLD